MSLERSITPPLPEAAPTVGPPPAHAPANEALRLQILATEHWSLLATRSLAWNETFSRAGMYISALSGTIVALALVAQATQFGEELSLFALVLLPVALFIGVTTFLRLSESNQHDALCVIGMNRIRGAYVAMIPDVEPLFVTSAHDDFAGIGVTMGSGPGGPQITHVLAATPVLVSTLNSVVLAAIAGTVALRLAVPVHWALGTAVVFAVASMTVHVLYGRRLIRRAQAALTPVFPTSTRA